MQPERGPPLSDQDPREQPDAAAPPDPLGRTLTRAIEVVCALLFAAMFVSFLIGVFTRYVLNNPVSWTIEVCSISYVWIVFAAAATIVRERQHIRFDMLYGAARPGTRRVFAVISQASLLAVFLIGLPTTLGYLQSVGGKRTMMLRRAADRHQCNRFAH